MNMKTEQINQADSNGLKQGFWRIRYDTDEGGGKCEGHFVNGKVNGPWRDWRSNGQLWVELNYANGVHHGFWKIWNVDGSLKFNGHYINGASEGEQIEYEY